MGGAKDTERKRRQQRQAAASKAPVKSSHQRERMKLFVGVGVVVAVVAVIVGGLIWTNAAKNETEGQSIPVKSADAKLDEKRDGVTVAVGSDDAPVTIDVYADFLCPACREFEHEWSAEINQRVEAGKLRVRQHMVPMLVNLSDPPGYSLDSANAAMCAADEGKFTPFHDSLFAAQPAEGARGWDNGQLIKLGRDIGISGEEFASCVRDGSYDRALQAEFAKIREDSKLHRDFGQGPGFSTPTVVGPAGIVTVKDGWLDALMDDAKG